MLTAWWNIFLFSSLSCCAQGHSDSITVVEQAAEAVKAEMVESVAVQEHHPPGYEAIEALSSELPLQFPFNDEIAEELG